MDQLRKVDVDGYTLTTFDTGRTDRLGKTILRYVFEKGNGKGDVIFEGEDFACSPCHAIDADETLRALMCFLTLRPGDTDRDYFDNYTPRQWEFVHSDAESLSIFGLEPEGDDEDEKLPTFVDVD